MTSGLDPASAHPVQPARPRRWPHVALGLYSAACLAALVWPVYDRAANHVEPYVFGLPFNFAWVAGLAMLTFLVLVGYYAVTEERR